MSALIHLMTPNIMVCGSIELPKVDVADKTYSLRLVDLLNSPRLDRTRSSSLRVEDAYLLPSIGAAIFVRSELFVRPSQIVSVFQYESSRELPMDESAPQFLEANAREIVAMTTNGLCVLGTLPGGVRTLAVEPRKPFFALENARLFLLGAKNVQLDTSFVVINQAHLAAFSNARVEKRQQPAVSPEHRAARPL